MKTTVNVLQQDFSNDFSLQFSKPTDHSQATLLLLHGWGVSSSIWQPALDFLIPHLNVVLVDLPGYGQNKRLDCDSLEDFLLLFERDVLPQLPQKFYLCGWSLGGLVATKIATRFALSVQGLITVACNPSFVISERWRDGVSEEIFENFLTQLSLNSTALLNRFSLLQTRGNKNAKKDWRMLRELLDKSEKTSEQTLRLGLQWLKTEELFDAWQKSTFPMLHQYGVSDQLVPVSLIDNVRALNKNHKVETFSDSSHIPFLSEPKSWSQSVVDFIQAPRSSASRHEQLIKKNIAVDFSQAANRYDELANFQHRAGEYLLSQLPSSINGHVLDLGSGTGYFSANLQSLQHKSGSLLVELDLAVGMLKYAQSQSDGSVLAAENTAYVQADFDNLPFAKDAFALVFSNLAVQWSANLAQLLARIYNALQSGGKFYFSTLLPGSLQEIADAWSNIDSHSHVHAFTDLATILQLVEHCGFLVNAQKTSKQVQYFYHRDDLLKSVKGIGAGRKFSSAKEGLLGKKSYLQLLDNFESMRNQDNQLPLTYQVAYFELEKP